MTYVSLEVINTDIKRNKESLQLGNPDALVDIFAPEFTGDTPRLELGLCCSENPETLV